MTFAKIWGLNEMDISLFEIFIISLIFAVLGNAAYAAQAFSHNERSLRDDEDEDDDDFMDW